MHQEDRQFPNLSGSGPTSHNYMKYKDLGFNMNCSLSPFYLYQTINIDRI